MLEIRELHRSDRDRIPYSPVAPLNRHRDQSQTLHFPDDVPKQSSKERPKSGNSTILWLLAI